MVGEGLIFDTHAHYDDPAFQEDRDSLLQRLFSENVGTIVNQGTTFLTSRKSLRLAEQYEGMYAAVGLHPECVDENSFAELERLLPLYDHPKTVAVGEIGLDYYYDTPRDLQKAVFYAQLDLAKEKGLPVTIHDREAHGDMLTILRQKQPKGILHCFSGSREMALEVVEMGMYIGFGGVITFRNARKTVETAQSVPLERIVLETDCPYLAPVPFRGKRNDSSLIVHVARKIGELRGLTEEEVLKLTAANARKVYGLDDAVVEREP